jgi:DNA adenine methylase
MSPSLQPFPWYGGKYKHRDFIYSNLPPRTTRYIEPFGGSAAILLNQEPYELEVFNDLNLGVYTLFKVLRDSPDELIERLNNTPWHEGEFFEAKASRDSGWDVEDEIERARQFYVLSIQSYNATGSSWSYSTSQVRRNRAQHTSRFETKIGQLEAVADRLRRVQFFCRDALDVIQRYEYEDATLYLDPPYPASVRGGPAYEFEMSDEQHDELLDVILDYPGYVCISTYQNDLYDERLSEWTLVRDVEKGTAASNVNQGRVECVYRNY